MNYIYRIKLQILLIATVCVLPLAARQYTIVNETNSSIRVYFSEERATDNYPVVNDVSQGTKVFNLSMQAQRIKIVLDGTSSIGRAVSFIYPNQSCGGVTIHVRITNNQLTTEAACS